MTEEKKKQIMLIVYQLAEHYEIPNNASVSFKKRSSLLELLNPKNTKAHQLVLNLIESVMISDRIECDHEKKEKNPEHWNLENANAQQEKKKSEELLKQFFVKEGVNLEGLSFDL